MFARITRAASPPDRFEQTLAQFQRDVMPQLRDHPGFVGAGALVDRQSGRAATVTYWADANAMQASEDTARTTREQASQAGNTVLDVQRYEIVIQERAAPATANAFVRTNEVDATADKLEDAIQFVRDKVVPTVRSQKGFRALLMGVDRQTGHCLVSSIWETAADREASEAAVRDQRREAGQVAGGSAPRVEYYDIALLEMKQPAPTS